MNMDLLLWVVRAVIIVVGITVGTMVWKGRKEGRYQKLSFRFIALGIPIFVIGIILLIVSFIIDLSFDTGLFLMAAGIIGLLVSFIIRSRRKKNR